MSVRYLVVDGHSVIFAWHDLRALHERNRALARKTLADFLRQMHDTTEWRVTLVLDGKLGTVVKNPTPKPTDMVICYATADQTADSIIERLVAASGKAGGDPGHHRGRGGEADGRVAGSDDGLAALVARGDGT